MITARLFIPTANTSGAYMLATTAGGVVLPPTGIPSLSAYMTSKTAQIKLMEWIAAENPNVFTCSIQPGVIESDMLEKSGVKEMGLPMDTGKENPFGSCTEVRSC